MKSRWGKLLHHRRPQVDFSSLGGRMSQPPHGDRRLRGMILGNDTGVAMTPFGLIVSAIAVAFLQLTDDLGHDFERLGADIDCDQVFIRCWLL
jgi:hypothetical protein